MSTKLFIISCLLLLQLAGLSQLTYENLYVDYDSAWQYKNLKLVPVRWKGSGQANDPLTRNIISLREALEKGVAKISERGSASTENVHWLIIENFSRKNILITSGEIIAGGRQDRMISRDTIILSSQQRIQIPVMCVEEGRWSEREKAFAYQQQANMHLRKVLDRSKNQVLIWREIYNQLERDKVKNTTISYNARRLDKKFIGLEQEYFQFFNKKFSKSDSSMVGVVCMSGDKVIGTDIFIASNLFHSAIPSLLYGYIQEAIIFGKPLVISDEKIKKYMDKLLKDEASQAEFIKENGKAFRQGGKLIHITSY